MNPLFDMLTKMQSNALGGSGQNSLHDQMAKQFGLQHDQAQKAMEALMPAFSQGLKRSAAATPKGMADFMQALASGGHSDYLQNPMKAFTPEGMQEGNAILGHLFGSKEVSRAVAAQAEAASGVSQSILKQMLPALAPMIMGGLFKQMANPPQAQQAFGGAGGGILGQILEEMMKGGLQGGAGRQGQPRARNPLEEILEQMTRGGLGQPSGQAQDNRGGNQGSNPGGSLGDIFNDMLKNNPLGQGGQQPSSENDPSPYDTEPQSDLDDIFGKNTGGRETRSEDPTEPIGYPKGTGLEDLFGLFDVLVGWGSK